MLEHLPAEAHGGDLAAARRAFPRAPEPWLDLSTGVNPYPYPVPSLPAEAWARLPEPDALFGLERAAALAYRAAAEAELVAASGSQAVINWLPRLVPARRVGVLGFAYAEHARAWRASGADVSTVEDLAALAEQDVAVIVNPNNPDGRLVSTNDLLALASNLERRGGFLVVDEAFADFLPLSASLAPVLPESGALVLRSFGKTYGLAGLRLGFAIAPQALAKRLRAALGPWPVSGAAIAIGSQALADSLWFETIKERLAADAAALDDILAGAGFDLIGGAPLFRLGRREDAPDCFKILSERGVLTRRFEARPSWLRFGLVRAGANRMRLRLALQAGANAPEAQKKRLERASSINESAPNKKHII